MRGRASANSRGLREDLDRKVGMSVFCRVTSQAKGYPFEVLLSSGLPTSGVALSDQVKSFNWQVRKAERLCIAPEEVVEEVLGKILVFIRKE